MIVEFCILVYPFVLDGPEVGFLSWIFDIEQGDLDGAKISSESDAGFNLYVERS